MKLILNWLLSAFSLMIVAHFVSGFHVTGFAAALIAALVIGLVNATIGLFLPSRGSHESVLRCPLGCVRRFRHRARLGSP